MWTAHAYLELLVGFRNDERHGGSRLGVEAELEQNNTVSDLPPSSKHMRRHPAHPVVFQPSQTANPCETCWCDITPASVKRLYSPSVLEDADEDAAQR